MDGKGRGRDGLDEGRRRREERRTAGWRRKEVRERPREDSATTEKHTSKACV